MKIIMNQSVLKWGIVLVLLFFLGTYFYKHHIAPGISQESEFQISEKGAKASLNSYKGKYILVSYFQTWCGDCIRELPSMKLLEEKVGKERLKVLMVSDESWDEINAFKLRFNPEFDCCKSEKSLKSLGIEMFPTTYLLNDKGEVIYSKLQGYNWASDEVLGLIK